MNPEDFFKSLIEYVRIKRNIKLIILVILLNLLGLIMSVLGYKLLTAFLGIIVHRTWLARRVVISGA